MIAFLVAGTASGVGKTTTALALMAALRQRGLNVQPFKCGPDFLDTGHHTAICGRASRNLDTWMLDLESNRSLFASACQGAGAAVVEGMMGLFDGVAGGGEQGSSAEIAKLLGLPVVLVVDASKSARSLAAVIKGFEIFDPDLRFAGVVLNGVAGDSHYRLLEQAILSSCSIPILGWLPRKTEVAIPERHLGLHSAIEQTDSLEKAKAFATFAEQYLDIDQLLQAAAYAPPEQPVPPIVASALATQRIRVGVALDRAFSFYYEDNFAILRQHGAEIVPFSPLAASQLPDDLDALYLGGGYPELHARALSENKSLLVAIREFADSGRPIYAECGGMMYLAKMLTNLEGESFLLADVLPLRITMTQKLVRFGYVEVQFTEDCLFGAKGTRVRGHSFHFSEVAPAQELLAAYSVSYSLSGRQEREGYSKGRILASYIHLHFRANPSIVVSFLNHAQQARAICQGSPSECPVR
jgi:cobyrinic acid a,c-diamide synthase